MEKVSVSSIITTGRIRSDLGNIDELASSIREFGLIQPIVLVRDESDEAYENAVHSTPMKPPPVHLVAGGRRLTAITRLGWKELVHAKHFVWRDEIKGKDAKVDLKLKAIEIEENVKRKGLTWQEEVLGRKQLLEIMQSIHGGPAKAGAPTRAEKYHGEVRGFGVNKLAAMLGVNAATISKDLQIANAITKVPALANSDSKEGAVRRLTTLSTIVSMRKDAAAIVDKVNNKGDDPTKKWVLYPGKAEDNVHKIEDESVDLIYTDLPFAVDLDKMSKHDKGVVGYGDKREDLMGTLPSLLQHAYRVLKPDRYAVLFFGFNYYHELCVFLENAGFRVNYVPFVWFKNSRSTENPNVRYGNSYDPALVAMKGSPSFIKPGMQNFFSFPQPIGANKLQVAQQPVELVTRFLQDMVVPGATVCDFRAGSGTTGVAAVKFGCKAIMFEREPEACAIINARMAVLK